MALLTLQASFSDATVYPADATPDVPLRQVFQAAAVPPEIRLRLAAAGNLQIDLLLSLDDTQAGYVSKIKGILGLRLSTRPGWSVRGAKPKRSVHHRTPSARGSERTLSKFLKSVTSTTILTDRTSVPLTQTSSSCPQMNLTRSSWNVLSGTYSSARFPRHTSSTKCV